MKKATLHDVARLAGVSAGTVSKYINGKAIGEKNQYKIQDAIERLDYSPSPLARNFASGKSYTLILYIIAESPIISSTWQYELPIIHGITDALKGSMYSLKIEIAAFQDFEENVRKLTMYAQNKYADGIILLSPWYIDDDLLLPLQYHKLPYVVVGTCAQNCNHGYIDFDNEEPMRQIVRDMYAQGCRCFGLIGGFALQRHMVCREQGFRATLAELGVPLHEKLICYTDYSLLEGYRVGMNMLSKELVPDAIVCGNDNIAAGVLRAIHEKGLKVPEDIVISGFDDSAVSEACYPPITTVRIPAYDLGMLAGSELMRSIEDDRYVIPNHLLKCDVEYKASTRRK